MSSRSYSLGARFRSAIPAVSRDQDATSVHLVCPRTVYTDLNGLFCKVIDGTPVQTGPEDHIHLRGGKPTVSRCAPLSLQLPLQLVEETPVRALGDDLLGGALDHADLLEAQGETGRMCRRGVVGLAISH
jgi:hypothetical protein